MGVYVVEMGGAWWRWWIFEMSIFYFAENYSQQDFRCSFLQQMVQLTAPSGNLPLSKRIWSSGWHKLPFKTNLWGDWGEVSTYINPCRSCSSLRLLQDVLWRTVRCSSCLWKRRCMAMTPVMQSCGKWFVWIMMLGLGWGNGTDTQRGWNILCLKRMSSLLILNAFAWLNV